MFCVYLTVYSGNKLPPFYIGSSSVHRLNQGYRGSVSSKEYKSVWKEELMKNPSLFKTKIISLHSKRSDAMLKELDLQSKLNVVCNKLYVNKSLAVTNGFFGMDVRGPNNPNFNNRWSAQQKKHASDASSRLHKLGVLKKPPILYAAANGRYGDKRASYIDKLTNKKYFITKAEADKIGGLVSLTSIINSSTETKDKISKTQKNDIRKKKYTKVTLMDPNGFIHTLNAFNYVEFIKTNGLPNILQKGVGSKKKGWEVIELEPNPLCTIKNQY